MRRARPFRRSECGHPPAWASPGLGASGAPGAATQGSQRAVNVRVYPSMRMSWCGCGLSAVDRRRVVNSRTAYAKRTEGCITHYSTATGRFVLCVMTAPGLFAFRAEILLTYLRRPVGLNAPRRVNATGALVNYRAPVTCLGALTSLGARFTRLSASTNGRACSRAPAR